MNKINQNNRSYFDTIFLKYKQRLNTYNFINPYLLVLTNKMICDYVYNFSFVTFPNIMKIISKVYKYNFFPVKKKTGVPVGL